MVFPSGGSSRLSNFKPSLGSAYITAYLEKNGFKARQFTSDESYNVIGCVEEIIKLNSKIVGFSVYESNYMQSVLISDKLKEVKPNIIVIFGGPTPTVQAKEILNYASSVDICVRGEGEEILLEIISNLSNNNFDLNQTDLEKIKGITFRRENKVIINPDSNHLLSMKHIKHYIDKYPSPYLSNTIHPSEASSIGIITARGCNQNCTYCNCAVLNNKNIYTHSTKRVIDELTYLNETMQFNKLVPINDDGFTIFPRRAKRICEEIIDNNIKLKFSCITRCDKIDNELIDLMKRAGFISLGFSLESAVPHVLRAIGKVNPPDSSKNFEKEKNFIEKLKNMTSYAKKIGIKQVYVSIMVGLPGESISDANKTINIVKKLNIDFYTHNFFKIYAGTPIFKNYQNYHYKISPIGEKNNIFMNMSYPVDVSKISIASNSSEEKNYRAIDFSNLKILSFNTKRLDQKPFFSNVIICSDIIRKSLVLWLQENLMLNGNIIHIYTSKEQYDKFHSKNKADLYDEFSPTMYYESYFWNKKKKIASLEPGRMIASNIKNGISIELRDTHTVLKNFYKSDKKHYNMICTENDLEDSIALYDLLVNLSNNKGLYNQLIENKMLPYFQNLCRWTNQKANCRKMETAIIGHDDSVRVCWHSNSIGSIGMPFHDIKNVLDQIKIEKRTLRDCDSCKRVKTCTKCLFPYPLSSKEYCERSKKNDTSKPAYVIDTLNLFKDLIYNPSPFFNY